MRYMVNDGTITEEQARTHPERNVLAQALGTRARIQRLHVEGPVPIVAGDVFMLCSDGLHDVVDAGRIAQQMAIRPGGARLPAADRGGQALRQRRQHLGGGGAHRRPG